LLIQLESFWVSRSWIFRSSSADSDSLW